MKCTKCEREAVYWTTNHKLCKEHFFDYFESKVFRTINKYRLFNREDKVCVATSGGKDSMSLLYVVNKYCKKRGIKFFSLAIDEGINGYRNEALDNLKDFCKEYDIKLEIFSFKDRYGKTMDQLREKAINEFGKTPCTICGTFRRSLLNKKARELGATKLATGHNMDDEAQNFLMNLFKGNMGNNASLGPIVGVSANEKFVPRVKPLYHILDIEAKLYAKYKEFNLCFCDCPHSDMSFRKKIKLKLHEIEKEVPGIKNGVVNSFMEIMPTLKERYKNKKEFKYCSKCGDACVGEKCNACLLEEQLCK